MSSLSKFAVAPLLALLLAACGGSAIPARDVTQAKTTISAAEAVGAGLVPRAALHLKMAKDEVAQAERLMSDGEEKGASLMLARAQADADLAVAMTKESQMAAEAAAARKRVDSLSATGTPQ